MKLSKNALKVLLVGAIAIAVIQTSKANYLEYKTELLEGGIAVEGLVEFNAESWFSYLLK